MNKTSKKKNKKNIIINLRNKRKNINKIKSNSRNVIIKHNINKLITFIKRLSLKNIFMLTIAGIINAIGITIFLAPVNLYDSGISGTSMLLGQISPEHMSLSIFLIILNIPLFLYGNKKQGSFFTFYAIYAVLIYSTTAWIIKDILPIDVNTCSPLAGTDILLCAIFGGVISGIGSGLAIRFGGAMDGIEVMAVIFAKRIGISVGTFVMIYNLILYIICGISTHSWILPLYSIITYTLALKTIDYIVEGIDRAKVAMIVTDRPNEICTSLTKAFESGMTKVEATGGYSNMKKTMIYFVLNRFQVIKMKNIVHALDPKAYITISDVADVFSVNSHNEEI